VEHPFHANTLKYYGCYIASTSTFVRRSALESVGLLDESLRVVMDYELFLRLAAAGKRFAYVPKTLGMFRVHGGNISYVEGDRRRQERLRVQLRYCGFRALPERLRIRAFDALSKVFTARRVVMRVRRRMVGTPSAALGDSR
jgi:GT2 family glycosyltransferase